MPSVKTLVVSLVAAVATFISGTSAQCLQQPQQRFQPQMAAGYQSRAIFSGLQQPRHMVVDSQGALLIASMGPVGIQHFRFTDNGGTNICVSSQQTLISNTQLNHGIALSPDSRTLYVSTATQVFSYPYDPVAVTVGSPRTLINIPTQGGYHQQRTLHVPRGSPNILLVSVGSEDNLDTATTNPQTGRSMVRAFNLDQLNSGGPVAYNSGAVFGWGLRNTVGIGENPANGEIWSVDNGLDNMMRSGRDVHNESPGEKLNFHSRANNTQSGFYGVNYGYPRCHPVWDTTVIPGFEVGSQVIQGNPSGEVTDQYCQTQPTPPRLTFASHTAPLDIKFTPDGRSAYITFHGSWNRSPADGYRLSRVDFGADGQPIHAQNSRTAEVRVMQNPNNSACPNGCFRPTGLAWDPRQSGRIFMSSDSTGELYVVTMPGGTAPPTSTSTTSSASPPTTTTTVPPTTTTQPGGTVPVWGQCGGQGYTGPTQCASGSRCVYSNPWYSQCLP